VGSRIAAALAADNEVVAFDNLETGERANLKGKGVRLVVGDVRDAAAVRRCLRGADLVFHEAAQISPVKAVERPDFDFAVNAGGTVNVLDAARRLGVRKVVFASTNVYGNPVELPIRETHRWELLSPYAAAKAAGEAYCMVFSKAYALETVRLRYSNVYGAGQRSTKSESGVIPLFLARLARGLPPVLFGGGRQTRDFVHVSDVVRANLMAAARDRADGEVFNVGSGRETSVRELAERLIALSGRPLKARQGPKRAADFARCRVDVSKARRVLGWRPLMPLEDGLREASEWWTRTRGGTR
jgi:UDP-glucose 4-epimerase